MLVTLPYATIPAGDTYDTAVVKPMQPVSPNCESREELMETITGSLRTLSRRARAARVYTMEQLSSGIYSRTLW